jgi:hypothetical protein
MANEEVRHAYFARLRESRYASAGQEQEHDGLRGHLIDVLVQGAEEANRPLLGQIAPAMFAGHLTES